MATPTLGLLNHTSISTCESTTGFLTFDTLDTDIKKEGSNGIAGTFRSDGTSGHYDAGSAPATAANKHIRMWINTTSVPYFETAANGGCEFFMFDNSTTEYYVIFSNEDYYGGWFNMVIDCNLFTTLNLANVDRWGVRVNYTTNAKNVDNFWIDYIRYLDGYYITDGTSGDKVRLVNVAAVDRGIATFNGYGIIEEVEGVYLGFGKIQIGNGATTTYFEMDGEVLVFTDQPVADGLFAIDGNGAGANILINGSTIKTAGTQDNTRFDFDMSTGSPGTVVVTNNVFQRGGAFTFASGQTVTGNSFTDCEQIIAAGADMSDCQVAGYEGTADTGALNWNVATDPDGYLDGMSFTKGTASTHAIEFGLSSPTSMTLRGLTFSGYNSSNSQTDSTFYVARTSGTVTISCVGCTGNLTYKSAGATVVIVADPVTVSVVVQKADGTKIQGARVFLPAAETVAGGMPYQASVTIVNSGTTATVTHTGHPFATNDRVNIKGASLSANNGTFSITVTGANTYTYTMSSSPGSSPTGTITSTFVFVYGLSDVNGLVSTSRVFSADQIATGWARKTSSSPYFKTGPISGTVSSSVDTPFTAILAPDE